MIVGDGFDDILSIVKYAANSNVEDIRILQRIHLRPLEGAHLAMRGKYEYLYPRLPRMAYSVAEPVSSEVAPRMLISSPFFANTYSNRLPSNCMAMSLKASVGLKYSEARLELGNRRDLCQVAPLIEFNACNLRIGFWKIQTTTGSQATEQDFSKSFFDGFGESSRVEM